MLMYLQGPSISEHEQLAVGQEKIAQGGARDAPAAEVVLLSWLALQYALSRETFLSPTILTTPTLRLQNIT